MWIKGIPKESGYYWMRDDKKLTDMISLDYLEDDDFIITILSNGMILDLWHGWSKEDQRKLKKCEFSERLKPCAEVK